MSTYQREQREMDAAQDLLRKGQIFQTVGWALMIFDLIGTSFVWVGFRTGSFFWLYYVIVLGGTGFVLALIGAYYRTKAGRVISRPGHEITQV